MLDTKLRPTSKDSAISASQIAIHIWISYVLNYLHELKTDLKTEIQTFYLRILGYF